MLVVVTPGQGSQTPGFLTPWLEVPGVRERLEWLSVVSGVDLVTHGTTSDADTIRDTAIAQPLIVGAGLVTLLSLFPHPGNAFAHIGAGAGARVDDHGVDGRLGTPGQNEEQSDRSAHRRSSQKTTRDTARRSQKSDAGVACSAAEPTICRVPAR